MNTSGEEHATHDSEVSEKEVHVQASEASGIAIGKLANVQIKYTNVDVSRPEQHIELGEIYQHLSPESANRILNMVDREEDYEKRAKRTELWLSIFGRIAIIIGISGVIVGFVFIGLHSKSSIPQIITSFVTGAAAVYALVRFRESREPRITFRHRDDDESSDSHQDVR